MTKSILISSSVEIDENFEKNLRPKSFEEYVGQNQLVENLKIFSQAAKIRSQPLDHILLSGPPGLGKTTLAYILAAELKSRIFITSGPALEKKGDLAGLLTNLGNHDILFIDEIHRLQRQIEENLYPAMEDFRFDIVVGEGAHARGISLDIKPFTLIGATTRIGLLSVPLLDRFGFSARLEFYEEDALFAILKRSASIMNIKITPDAISEIAAKSRGTPRIANRLIKRIRDYAQVSQTEQINSTLVKNSFQKLGIFENGLDLIDKKILMFLTSNSKSIPVGIDALAVALGESANTIEDVHEPFLIREGYLIRTSRGRMATEKAFKLFNDANTANIKI